MRIETFSTLSSHINSIVTTNTAQYLSGGLGGAAPGIIDIPCRAVSIAASSTNVSAIGVGPVGVAVSSGYPLEPGESVTLDIDNMNKVQVAGTQNDLVSWLAVGVD